MNGLAMVTTTIFLATMFGQSAKSVNEGPKLLVAPFSPEQAKAAQVAWSKSLNLPVAEKNALVMKLVLIPAGEFEMGSPLIPKGRVDYEGPPHRVRITKPYYLGATEVTQAQWQAVMGTEPWKRWEGRRLKEGADYPATNMSWEDAAGFCERLSIKESKTYRLPTEAEWEYACRGGTTTLYWNGDDPEELAKVANVADASAKRKFLNWPAITADDGHTFYAPVGSYRENAFGLYDMHGNVWEWCADWFGRTYYAESRQDDPQGPSTGGYRVKRGGCWNTGPQFVRSTVRFSHAPIRRSDDLGFRVALEVLSSE